MRSVLSVLLLALVGVGCSDTLGPAAIDGRWAEDLSQVESLWEVDLTANGSSIVGTGSWYGEACCSGTLAVTGTMKGAAVHLDITKTFDGQTTTSQSQFDGVLVNLKLMQGTLTYGPPDPTSAPMVLHRQ